MCSYHLISENNINVDFTLNGPISGCWIETCRLKLSKVSFKIAG